MKLYKLSKILLALLFLLTVSINMSSAAGTFNTCPGEPRNLSWTSANSGVCNGVVSGANSNECAFNPNPNVAGNRSVSINSLTGTCNATISCTNAGSATAVSDTTTLNVVNKASCCGTGSQTNQPNAYTDPSSGFRCNCPAGTYNNGANTCTTLLAPTVTAVYSGLDHPLVTPTCPTPLIIATLIRTTGPNPILIDNTGSGADPSSDGRGGGSPVRE